MPASDYGPRTEWHNPPDVAQELERLRAENEALARQAARMREALETLCDAFCPPNGTELTVGKLYGPRAQAVYSAARAALAGKE